MLLSSNINNTVCSFSKWSNSSPSGLHRFVPRITYLLGSLWINDIQHFNQKPQTDTERKCQEVKPSSIPFHQGFPSPMNIWPRHRLVSRRAPRARCQWTPPGPGCCRASSRWLHHRCPGASPGCRSSGCGCLSSPPRSCRSRWSCSRTPPLRSWTCRRISDGSVRWWSAPPGRPAAHPPGSTVSCSQTYCVFTPAPQICNDGDSSLAGFMSVTGSGSLLPGAHSMLWKACSCLCAT